MFSQVMTKSVNQAGVVTSYPNTYSGGSRASIDELIPDGAVDLPITSFGVDVSVLQAIIIGCNKAITFETGGAKADETYTLASNVSDGDDVTIDSKVYTFQTSLTDTDGNVLIGATASDTIDNLVAAIMLASGAGTTYAASMTLHPTATAVIAAGDTMLATAKLVGTAGNSLVTTENGINSSWGAGTMSGGVASDVTLNLLAGKPYDWDVDSYFTNLLTADISVVHITNASGSVAVLKAEAVIDATPS